MEVARTCIRLCLCGVNGIYPWRVYATSIGGQYTVLAKDDVRNRLVVNIVK